MKRTGIIRTMAASSLIALASTFVLPGVAQAAIAHGISFEQGCSSPIVEGGPLLCNWSAENADNTGALETITANLTGTVTTSGGPVTFSLPLSSLYLSTDQGGTTCNGTSGTGTLTDPWIGATSCSLPSNDSSGTGINHVGGDLYLQGDYNDLGDTDNNGFVFLYSTVAGDYGLPSHSLTVATILSYNNASQGAETANFSGPVPIVYQPTVTTALTPATPVTIGTSVSDQATLVNASPDAGGTISYGLYSDDTCTTLVQDLTPTTATVSDGAAPPSNGYTFTSAGTWYFQATYSGDANNNNSVPVSSSCTSEPLMVNPNSVSVTTALTPATPVTIGTSVSDQATLVGATATAGGTISYGLYSDDTCTTLVQDLTPTTATVSDGAAPPSNGYTFTSAGTWYFQATYSGDANNNNSVPVSSSCTSEPLMVNPNSVSVTTALTPATPVTIGTSVSDQATLVGATATAGGTISYGLYSDDTCTTLVQDLTPTTATVSDGAAPPSNGYTFTSAGTWYFQATYSGDANNNNSVPVSSSCTSEPLMVNPNSVSVTTALTPATPVTIGTSVSDQATLVGATATAGGTISYGLYSDDTCTTLVQDLTPTTATVSDGAAPPSNGYTFTSAGTWYFQATYSGDANNNNSVPVSSSCTSEPLMVINPSIAITKLPASQTIVSGGTATWTIVVTNTGDVSLTDVTVADPLAPNCNDTFPGTLVAGASEAGYSCSRSGVTAGFTNIATATGTPPVGPNVTNNASAVVLVTTPSTANFTPGYWKTHGSYTQRFLPQTLGGYSVTSNVVASEILSEMGCGSSGASRMNCMAGMLLAAELNLAQGGSTCISGVVASANTLLTTYLYNGPNTVYGPISATDSALALKYHDELSSYNIDGIPTC